MKLDSGGVAAVRDIFADILRIGGTPGSGYANVYGLPATLTAQYTLPLRRSIETDSIVQVEITSHHTYWEFPADPFVEYEPSDENWARPLGFGRERVGERKLSAAAVIVGISESGEIVLQTVPRYPAI